MKRLALLPLLLLGACGGGTDCNSVDGSIALSWTIRGDAPAVACASNHIDTLEVVVAGDGCPLATHITNVLCNTQRFQYDQMLVGDALITVTAYDAQQNAVAAASIQTHIAHAVPNPPLALDLR